MKLLIDVLGWSGSGFLILAYGLTLVENNKYVNYSKYLNLFGALLIAINCYYYNAIPSFVSNLIWSVMATFTLYRTKRKERVFNHHKVITKRFFRY
ncbi:CBU_0592 family membrane protein [Polaribacter butkevichii]|uniref:CBU-0592-like domain-containing protein n=1 Tax=Polaribacter butkevichii TaxID=218490 RepID=A0A2P6CDJ1_9FLAO|nr:hypothetical protein [Polaribacter butkevichii]PQJ72966.1 hypothetical protein BTO14_06715 [Polaribacter butkevichii]